MRKNQLFVLLLVFFGLTIGGYALNNFKYTGIAFDGSGNVIASASNVTVQIQILNLGTVVYDETHSNVTTTQFGAYTVTVGTGTVNSGNLATVQASKNMKIKATTSQGGAAAGVWVVSTILKPTLAITGSTGKFWKTKGNSGTDPANNFIGTTDDVDFVFKTNDAEAMRIDNDGNVGIGTDDPAALLDVWDPTATGKTFSRSIMSAYDQSYFKIALTSEFSLHGQGQTDGTNDIFYSGYFDVEIANDNTDVIGRVVGAQGQISNLAMAIYHMHEVRQVLSVTTEMPQ